MNNIVAKRFQNDKVQHVISPIDLNPPEVNENDAAPAPAPPSSPIVPPEKLRAAILEKLNPEPLIVVSAMPVTSETMPAIELVHFASLYEFAHWYESNKRVFSEKQQKPLDSILEARNITLGACNCDMQHRRSIAEDYFKNFWIQNRETDLLPTLQSALKTKKIIFGDFLVFPE